MRKESVIKRRSRKVFPKLPPAFYLVWREYGHQPTYKHPDKESARTEAERLAKLSPNVKFFVLPAADCVVVETNPPKWITATQVMVSVPEDDPNEPPF